jgi:hypothetical protein
LSVFPGGVKHITTSSPQCVEPSELKEE